MVITDGSCPLAGRSTEANYYFRTIRPISAEQMIWVQAPWTAPVNREKIARFFAADAVTMSIRSRW